MASFNATATPKDRVVAYFQEKPNAMTSLAARELGVPEAEVVRQLPDNRATELRADRFAEMVDALQAFGKVYVIVSNTVTTIESFGVFGGISKSGEYFNVQSDSLDMHIRYEQLGSVFAVEKPSHMSGVPTLSFQFFDRNGASAFKAFLTFGQKEPDEDLQTKWTAFRDEFALS
jgi:putative hemin transport protein